MTLDERYRSDGDRRRGADRGRALRTQRRAHDLAHGYRDRTLDTRLGSLQLRVPKLRQLPQTTFPLTPPPVMMPQLYSRISTSLTDVTAAAPSGPNLNRF